MVRIGDLLKALKRKTFGSPTGLEPPYLGSMLDHTAWALQTPGSYTEIYVKSIRADIDEARRALDSIEQALPMLDERTLKKWIKRKRKS